MKENAFPPKKNVKSVISTGVENVEMECLATWINVVGWNLEVNKYN
jgi:hypothetical protein